MLGRSLLLKVRRPQPVYPDYVQEYISRVIAADVAAGNNNGLEYEVSDAISACLQALVADGILGVSGGVLSQPASLIKAGCFMMGARTLSGALVPLAADMPAPTNFNFVSLDYNRRTGLVGDGTTKYLNSNRANSADPQDNCHLAVHGVYGTSYGGIAGNGSNTSVIRMMQQNSSTAQGFKANNSAISELPRAASGLLGVSRSQASFYSVRSNGASTNISEVSATPVADSILIFRRGSILASGLRLSFYSAGQSLNLAVLDARITALSNAIQVAIPA